MTQIQSRPSLDQIFNSNNSAETSATQGGRPSLDEIFGAQQTTNANVQNNVQPQTSVQDRIAAQKFPTSTLDIIRNIAQDPTSVPNAALHGLTQGGTLGLGDEATAAFRSATGPVTYQQAKEQERNANQQASSRYPGLYGASEALGAIASPLNKLGLMPAAAISGYGYSNSDNPSGQVKDIGESLVAGKALETALPAVLNYFKGGAESLKNGWNATTKEGLDTIENSMRDNASGLYDKMADIGANISPNGTAKIASNINTALKESIGSLDPVAHAGTISKLKSLEETINQAPVSGNMPEGNVSILGGLQDVSGKGEISLKRIDQIRRTLSDINPLDKGDVKAAGIVRNALDDSLTNLTPEDLTNGSKEAVDLLESARAQSSQYKKFEMISNILKDADGDPVKIKNGLNTLLKTRNEMKIAGFSDDELGTLETAAKSSNAETMMKGLGAIGFKPIKNPFTAGGETLALLTGHLNPAAVGAIATGTVTNQLAKYMARGKAEQFIQALQGGEMPKDLGKLPPRLVTQLLQTYQGRQQ